MEYFRFTHTPFSMIGTDRLGSAILRYETSTHVRINYQPFGHQSNSLTGHIGFSDQIQEPRFSGYILGNGYRTYIPTLHRFCSADSYSPFGRGGINAYAYCRADPVNEVDPSGHMAGRIRKFVRGLFRRNRGNTTSRARQLGSSSERHLAGTIENGRIDAVSVSSTGGRGTSPSREHSAISFRADSASSPRLGEYRSWDDYEARNPPLDQAAMAQIQRRAELRRGNEAWVLGRGASTYDESIGFGSNHHLSHAHDPLPPPTYDDLFPPPSYDAATASSTRNVPPGAKPK